MSPRETDAHTHTSTDQSNSLGDSSEHATRPHQHSAGVFGGTNNRQTEREVGGETDEQPAGGMSLGQEEEELRWALHSMTGEAIGVLQ